MIRFKPHQSINIISDFLPDNPIIVEVGAFKGTDSIKMAKKWPKGLIHAFEPVPELYQLLEEKSKPYHNIKTYKIALDNKTGTSLMYLSEKKISPGKFPRPILF